MRPMTMPPMRRPDRIRDGLADSGRAPRRYASSVALQGKMRNARSSRSMSEAIGSSCERTYNWTLGASTPGGCPELVASSRLIHLMVGMPEERQPFFVVLSFSLQLESFARRRGVRWLAPLGMADGTVEPVTGAPTDLNDSS